MTTKTRNRQEGEKLTAEKKRVGRVTSADLKRLAEPKAEVEATPEPQVELAPQAEPKVEKVAKVAEPKYWQEPLAVEAVACLGIEVADEQGRFTASAIEKELAPGTWATVVTIMKQSEGTVFVRATKASKWQLAGEMKAALAAVTEPEVPQVVEEQG